MESALWALNLVALCLLCIWALREDERTPPQSGDSAALTPAVKSARKAGPEAVPQQNQR